jgi:hypothetical protein
MKYFASFQYQGLSSLNQSYDKPELGDGEFQLPGDNFSLEQLREEIAKSLKRRGKSEALVVILNFQKLS